MIQPDPMLRPDPIDGESEDRALRPQMLSDFVGQAEARANLRVFIESAKLRGKAMDHTLFHGPPGLGKTTLAQIMARELGVNFKMTSGPVLARAGDLAAILTNLEARDVLFIDEIHRMNPAVEEILYPALEDFELDLVIGEGPAARTVRIELQPFTLVGATTRLGLLTTPLRDRFRNLPARDGVLLRGPAGWGEFSPFWDYDDATCVPWLRAAVEAATLPFPEPRRTSVPVNATVPAVGPERAAEIVRASGCATVKVKVAQAGQELADDLDREVSPRMLWQRRKDAEERGDA